MTTTLMTPEIGDFCFVRGPHRPMGFVTRCFNESGHCFWITNPRSCDGQYQIWRDEDFALIKAADMDAFQELFMQELREDPGRYGCTEEHVLVSSLPLPLRHPLPKGNIDLVNLFLDVARSVFREGDGGILVSYWALFGD